MFKILDWYIIRKFLGTFVFAVLLLSAVVIMFDVNEKLDAFFKAPLRATVFDYFLNFIPAIAAQYSSLLIFISVIFFTSKLAERSEIIAMLSAGVSFNRLMRPYMISAAVIAVLMFGLNAYLIPPANVKRIDFTNTYVKNKRVDYGSNIMLMAAPGEVAYMSRYDAITKTGIRFSLEKFEGKKLVSRLTASTIRWDTLYNWRVQDYIIRDLKGNREVIQKGYTLDTVIPFEPRDFLIAVNDHEKLTSPALAEYVQRQRDRGVGNIQAFEIEYHRRIALAASTFILTVIGMSLSSRKAKGGMGLKIGIGLVLCFSYILFMSLTESFAQSELTPPWLAMWIPNIVYSVIALILYRQASR